nr:hypothetical protein [Oscillochloris trichoides]
MTEVFLRQRVGGFGTLSQRRAGGGTIKLQDLKYTYRLDIRDRAALERKDLFEHITRLQLAQHMLKWHPPPMLH